jgi:predicted alpha/beta hydrolase
MARTVEEVRCTDGWSLAVDVLAPEAPRAVALLGHAMMADRRTLDAGGDGLASHLERRGIAVVMADLRGHGASGPGAAAGGQWSYDDLVEADTRALLDFVGRRFPKLRRVVVGHSLFGHVALAHAIRYPQEAADAIVALSANIWTPRWEPEVRLRLAKRTILETGLAVARTVGYLPARRLRLGSCDESLPFWQQMTHWQRHNDWYASDGFSYLAHARRLQRPVLALVGTGDRLLCRPVAARRFYAELPAARLEVVGSTTGLGYDPDHMDLVTDQRSRPLWERIANYIAAG